MYISPLITSITKSNFTVEKKKYDLALHSIFYSLLSYVTAAVHYLALNAGLLKYPPYLLNTAGEDYKILRLIWRARIFRSMLSILVRSPFRRRMLRLINFTIPLPVNSGCVIVICHTPWERLLKQWCLENNFGLAITSGKLTSEKKQIMRNGKGYKELKDLATYLKQNGRIIITADTFNNLTDCPVQFLGEISNASLFPARLAGMANVPLIVAIPFLYKGNIHFISGPSFDFRRTKPNFSAVTKNILHFLEHQILKDPSICPFYVK